MTEQAVAIEVVVPGADESAMRMAAVAQSFKTADKAQASYASTAKVANDNMARFNRTNEASARALNILAGSFRGLNPQLDALQDGVMAASGTIKSLTALLGGPLGIALGAATAAVALMGQAWSRSAEQAEEYKKAAEEAAKAMSYEGRLKAIMESKDAAALQRKLTQGGASPEQYQARLEELKGKIDASGGLTYGKGALQDQYREVMNAARLTAQQEKDRAELEREIDVAGGMPSSGGGASASSGGGWKSQRFDPSRPNDDPSKMLAALDAEAKSRVDAQKQLEDASKEARKQHLDEMKALDKDYADFESSIAEQRVETERLRASEQEAIKEAEAQQDAARRQMMISIAGATANALTGELAKMAKGHKANAGAMIESIGDFMVADGTRAMLQGAVMSANPLTPGIGGGLIAAGAVELAAGLALGAVGARSGGSNSRPSGSGGAGSGQGASAQGRATSPYASSGNALQGGSQTVIVNMPTVVSPSAEDGRRVQQATEKANRVYGRPRAA